MNQAVYNGININSVSDLSFLLRYSIDEIIETSEKSGIFYRENPQKKKDGGLRMTYIVNEPLKRIQSAIYKSIFQQIYYPRYLMGSIKDKDYPRDYIRDAELHCGSDWILVEDIKSFFPSIQEKLVGSIYSDLLGFSQKTAEILSKLTTYKGTLPQGAATSAVIANLVLWKEEPGFYNNLTKNGFIYSRYVDDITISYLGIPNK